MATDRRAGVIYMPAGRSITQASPHAAQRRREGQETGEARRKNEERDLGGQLSFPPLPARRPPSTSTTPATLTIVLREYVGPGGPDLPARAVLGLGGAGYGA